MLNRVPFEAICWLVGLSLLAFSNPAGNHFSICPLYNAGFSFCPGCGLGRSVSLFFNGEISASFRMHPLGIFTVIILSFRIISLTQQYLKNYGKSY